MNNAKLLKLTSLNVGDTITGTITGIEQGKYGAVIVMNIGGETTKVFPAGNLKRFFAEDEVKGIYNIGNSLTITRKEDATLKNGVQVSQFLKSSKSGQATTTATPASPVVDEKARLQAKLAAARKAV
jgi:ribosomal protein S1